MKYKTLKGNIDKTKNRGKNIIYVINFINFVLFLQISYLFGFYLL